MDEKKKTISVIKRDGRIIPFKSNKIINALKKAYLAVYNESNDKVISSIGRKVNNIVKKQALNNDDSISVEQIQDIIEDILIKQKEHTVAKEYIKYRSKRTRARNSTNDLMKIYASIFSKSSEDLEIKRDNANSVKA